MSTEDYSDIGRRSQTWGRYDEQRRFRGVNDGKERVELDSSRFSYIPKNKRMVPLDLHGMEKVLRDALRRAYDNIEIIANEKGAGC